MDTGADDPDAGQWMTYPELGQLRGISKESALKLALRKKWRRQKDNRGVVRVCVPLDWAKPQDMGAASGADDRVDLSRAVTTLGGAVAVLQEQLRAERGRAGRAEVELIHQREAVAAARAAQARAEGALAQAMQSDQERRTAGLWARLKAAWQGE